MTVQDRKIQDLKQQVRGLQEELRMAVEACRICRLCSFRDEDCSPSGPECKPKWRGDNA
jgi:hypothetical protein